MASKGPLIRFEYNHETISIMPLPIPQYLQAAKIQDSILRYKWDDWNTEGTGHQIDEESYNRLVTVSQRANLAFAISTTEWIVYRFTRLLDDSLPTQYLEAAWAQVVQWRYRALTIEGDTDSKNWAGPIRSPVWWALALVEYASTEAEHDGNPSVAAARIANLAQHIMTDATPYRKWCDCTIKRLEYLYPWDPEEHLGEVVPREALDPGLDFRIEQTESLINRFLASLDYQANPFLNSPEVMLQQGFEGIPYVFSIEKDRQDRFEW